AWLSPAFPTGGFAYSHGIEWAVQAGDVRDAATAGAWIEDAMRLGTGRSDAILLRAAHAGAPVADLARAVATSAERLLETASQGEAFAAASRAWGGSPGENPYPVAVGRLAAAHGIGADATVAAYLQGFAGNLISAAVRLVPLGQSAGLAVLASLAPVILAVTEETREAGIDDLGTGCFRAEIAAMRHETQYTRLFRT
ncbi:MAG: urease accessory protein UreF, partial [Acidisphaera sp.]|nr:urease accessory protein UreF [Acidisphaera sp.]